MAERRLSCSSVSPIDPITAQNGFSMETGGNPVPGNFTYSANDETVTFTPVNPLTASTTYTVGYTRSDHGYDRQSADQPGQLQLHDRDRRRHDHAHVTAVDPPNDTFGVGLNVTPHVTFSEPVNGTNHSAALILYYQDDSVIVPATVTVSANRLTATMTPSVPLLPNTYYYLYLCGYTDIAGNNGSCFASTFFTGTTAVTSPAHGEHHQPH